MSKKSGKDKMPAAENRFAEAVSKTDDISGAYKAGLGALGEYKNKIKVPDTKKICGSVDIDGTTKDLYPEQNRWDFALCYDGEVFFIEVHPALPGEVKTVVKKYEWLKSWLAEKAIEISKLSATTVTPFYWIQTSKFAIPAHTPQYRLAAQHRLLPISVWDYSKIKSQK